jgi:hypothetical protein
VNLEEESRFPAAMLVGAGVVVLLLGGVFLLTRESQRAALPGQRLPLGPGEQAYAASIHFRDLRMSRAANFLNQEVTFLFGVVSNDGPRTVRQVEVTIEFRNVVNQLVLRETQRLFGQYAAPLAGGQSREFQLTFEHVPLDWNRQYPSLRVTGLLLE